MQDGQNPSTKQRENPHKYLLYKPTFGQLTTFLASGYRELPPGGAMLLYLSADGSAGTAKHSDDSKYSVASPTNPALVAHAPCLD